MTLRDQVSRGERRVLDALLEGLPNKAIALRIGVSESTVKMHIKAMCLRVGAMNRTGLVLHACDGFPKQMAEMKDQVEAAKAEATKLRQLLLEKSAEVRVLERMLTQVNPAAMQIAAQVARPRA